MHQLKKFKNGVRFVGIPLKDAQTATILVLVGVGSRFENNYNNGISHFIEHMMFKGTKKRPTAFAISSEVDGIGAEFNAYTSKDYTGYFIKADAKHLDLAIDVLSDMVLRSKFEAKEIAREKGVIIEEINMREDNPLMHIEDLLEQVMFQGNTLGYSIAGQKKNIKQIKRQDFIDYYSKFYRGENIVIAIAGRYSDADVETIEKKFAFSARPADGSFSKFQVRQAKPRVSVMFKDTKQVQLALGFYGYPYRHDSLPALKVLSTILGGNMSSRLFLRVRERNGLAYFVRSYTESYKDTGNLFIQSGLDKTRIDKALSVILDELAKIKRGVNDEELKRAKNYLSGQLALDLEDTADISRWYAMQELMTERIVTPKEKISMIAAASKDQIKLVANEVINFSHLNLAVIGPYKDTARFERLINKHI